MADLSRHSIAIVVLAAGRGQRMGDRPKLLLPLADGKPVVWHSVTNALLHKPSELVVVVHPDLPGLQDALVGLPVSCVVNPDYAQGMGTSLAVGVRALSEHMDAAFVMLGDEPDVDPSIVDGLLAAYLGERKPVVMPRYGKESGPPTLFGRAVFSEMAELQGDTGGRQIVANHPDWVEFVSFPEEMRPRDIDTPEDYSRAL